MVKAEHRSRFCKMLIYSLKMWFYYPALSSVWKCVMKNDHLHFCFQSSLMLPWKRMSSVSHLKPASNLVSVKKNNELYFKCLFCFLLPKLCTVLQRWHCHIKTLEAFKMPFFCCCCWSLLCSLSPELPTPTASYFLCVCKDQVVQS